MFIYKAFCPFFPPLNLKVFCSLYCVLVRSQILVTVPRKDILHCIKTMINLLMPLPAYRVLYYFMVNHKIVCIDTMYFFFHHNSSFSLPILTLCPPTDFV